MKVLICQPRGKEKLVEAFKNAGAEVLHPNKPYQTPDLIIPTVDEELPTMAYLSNCLPIVVGSEYTIFETRNKNEFYRFCKRHGFLTPSTMQSGLIAKPVFGKASKGVIKLDNSYIVQEDMSDLPEVSIDYFADAQGNPLSIVPRFRKNVVNGESQAAEFITDMDLTEVTRLGKELMLIGHNVIQGFYTKTQFFFTEVNCRYGGGSWMTFEKFNSPKWLVDNHEQFSKRRDDTLRS